MDTDPYFLTWRSNYSLVTALHRRTIYIQWQYSFLNPIYTRTNDIYTIQTYTRVRRTCLSYPDILQTPNPSSPALPKSCPNHVRSPHIPIIAPPIGHDLCWHNTRDVTRINLEVSFPGIEPVTWPFKGRCSTNWATNPINCVSTRLFVTFYTNS